MDIESSNYRTLGKIIVKLDLKGDIEVQKKQMTGKQEK